VFNATPRSALGFFLGKRPGTRFTRNRLGRGAVLDAYGKSRLPPISELKKLGGLNSLDSGLCSYEMSLAG
jgi:hypothetical protein